MGEIIKNVLVTAIVLFVMRLIMAGVERRAEKVRQIQEEAKSTKKKNGKTKNPIILEKVTIEYEWGIKALMIVAFIFFCLLFLGCATGFFYNVETFSFVGSLLFVILGAIGVGGTVFWRIKVDGDNIEYTDYIGIKHHYKYSELSRIDVYKKKTKVYKDGRLIFTIDDNLPDDAIFNAIAKNHGVKVNYMY